MRGFHIKKKKRGPLNINEIYYRLRESAFRRKPERRLNALILVTLHDKNVCIMAEKVTDSNFEEKVLKSDKPVLVDFWAEWCGPCLAIAPVIDELSKEYEGKADVVKLNVDENPQVPMNYGIMNIPTLLIFKNGEVVDKQVGAAPKPVLAKKLDAQMANA
mgnify:FL=1